MNYINNSLNETKQRPELRVKLAKLSAECCKCDSNSELKLSEILDNYNQTEIADILINDGLAGFLWNNINKSEYFTHNNLEGLKKYRFDVLRYELLIRQKIPELWQQFNKINIDPILFRGLSYSAIYSSNVFRDTSDIDILIQKSDFEKLINLLLSMGWQSYFNYPDQYWKDGVSIDIHTEMMGAGRKAGRNHAGEISADELFQRSNTMTIEGMIIRVLGPIDDLICASVHWLKHSFTRMCWGVDICLLCQVIAENNLWDEAVNRIQNCSASKLVKFGLLPIEKIFSVSLPEVLSAEKSGIITNRLTYKLLDAVSRGETVEHSGYLLYADTFSSKFLKYQFYLNVIYPKSSDRMRLNNTLYSDSRNWMFPFHRIKRGLKSVSNLSRFYFDFR
jgi:hypothetical protein